MVRLFIENNEIELTDNVQVAITKQFEDLTNPTTIINDWSKTISIPFTARNNSIFGHIYNPDKTIVDGGSIGVYFNPLLKLDFRLEWANTIIMIGYAKLNEVKQVNGKGTYEITLFGELGKVLQEMRKITFDTSTDDTDYLIDGSQYVNEAINKELVYASWTSSGQTTDDLLKKTDSGYTVTDIIGFAPNNSFVEGFDYKTFQSTSTQSEKFTDFIENNVQFKENTGINLDTVIPNGFLPREWAEYRSYLQLPYIYWNKLFKVFQEKAESVTGYQFELDSDWFNTANPYWYNLVYMLKAFDIKLGNDYFNQFMSNCLVEGRTPDTNEIRWYVMETEYGGGDWTDNTYSYLLSNVRNITGNASLYDGVNNTMVVNDDTYDLIFALKPALRNVYGNGNAAEYYQSRTTLHLPLVFDLIITGSNGYVETKRAVIISDNAPQAVQSIRNTADVVIVENGNPTYATYPTTREWQWDIKFPSTHISSDKFGTSISIKVDSYFYKNGLTDFPIAIADTTIENTLAALYAYVYDDTTIFNYNNITKARFHSGNEFILNDLWNKDYNLFSAIIKYCKMFRIGISVDEFDKKIIFKPIIKYFENYTVSDWTNIVDKSKDFIITPITFENKYVLFNYNDSDTKIGKEYKEKYGINYGEYRLVTDYNFNSETTDLFEDITPSIVSTDNVLNYYWLVRNRITYSFPAEIFVSNKDKDKKGVDLFGAYFFHNGTANFELNTDLHMKYPFISDDTEWQDFNNTFMYNMGAAMSAINVDTYPKLDVVYGNNLCLFNVPKENYTYLSNYSTKKSIYTNFWENYLNERYNIQNKKITCYVNLKPHIYNQFQWNKLVKIGNQLCIVNKIYDYNITDNQPTKVDLITIQDIDGYRTNNY